MAMKAKHAFGSLADVQSALNLGKIDNYDILFLDGDTEPKIGWIDAKGEFRLVKNEADFSELEAIIAKKADAEEVESAIAKKADITEIETLEGQIATKANAADVDAKVDKAVTDSVTSANAYTDKMVEAAMGEHLTKKYEITDVPESTIVDMRDKEIRVMVPANAVFTKQNVGTGGDANSYYMTFKTYFPDNAVGYIEHLSGKSDSEILTSFSVDEYNRKYQPTWLALAKYDETTDTWNYYGKSSTANKYIGWDYQIDWYNADGVMIASDSVRINLSNENCHSIIEPYYVGSMMKEVETLVEEKIAEVEVGNEIIEF
jgi:hypothetical protein